MRGYRLIDGDQHVIEPPDLWTKRLPKKYRERAPHLAHMEQGDAWVMEGAVDPITFGHNALGGTPGGLRPENRREWIRWEEVPPGCYDPAARLKAMDEDGVTAALIYPTPRISGAIYWNNSDPEFHLECIRVYNNWLSEFCAYAPDRLGGIAMIPTTGIHAALGELRRALKLPGIRSFELKRWPSGSLDIAPEDDAFFGTVQEAQTPVNIHVAFATGPSAAKARGATGDMRHLDAPVRAKQIINAGVLDRFPDLKAVFGEVDCGWVPYVKEQMDDRFKRLEPASRPPIKMCPSEYFARNLFFVYITDRFAIAARDWIGVTQMIWSSDYPHTGTDFPYSWQTINEHFMGVPEQDKHAILAGNAACLYRFLNDAHEDQQRALNP